MCLLTYVPSGVLPDVEALYNGTIINEDGHGFAIVAGDNLIIRRGLDGEQMVEQFAIARKKHPDGPALFHSRFSTHGKTHLRNCHPFYVGGDKRTVIAHNGVLPPVVHPKKDDWRSDTRIAAEWYIPQVGHLRSRLTRLRLEKWMTRANKMVILTTNRSFKEPSYILNEHMGTWDLGIWYSNDGYLPPRYSTRATKWLYTKDDRWSEYRCEECLMYEWDCQCWTPKKAAEAAEARRAAWDRWDDEVEAITQGTGWPEATAVRAEKLA